MIYGRGTYLRTVLPNGIARADRFLTQNKGAPEDSPCTCLVHPHEAAPGARLVALPKRAPSGLGGGGGTYRN